VLKGPALAATVYPSIALRPFGDLDLLLPRQHLATAVQALRSLGYQEAYPDKIPRFTEMVSNNIEFRSTTPRRPIVELHWGLIAGDNDLRSPPLDWFWEQTVPLDMSRSRHRAAGTMLVAQDTSSECHSESEECQNEMLQSVPWPAARQGRQHDTHLPCGQPLSRC
jgi:hypothetical protein